MVKSVKKLTGTYKQVKGDEEKVSKAFDLLFEKVLEKRNKAEPEAELTPEEDLMLDSLVDHAFEELKKEKAKKE